MAHSRNRTTHEKGWAKWELALLLGVAAVGMPGQTGVFLFCEAPSFHPACGNFEATWSCLGESCSRDSSRAPKCHIC
jgi:hypothetical protein